MNRISIIICTYNRSTILKEAILSIVKNSTDFSNYEIVVVDNNSKDNTYETVTELQKKYKHIKYYKEKKQGLSSARNKGIKVATHEIIAFVDDDILMSSDYVFNINKFFEKNPKAICGGGKIYTIWDNNKPLWFNEGFFSIIGETRYGEQLKILKNQEYPYGGNMFFKKTIFEKIGFFDENLGLNGDEIKMGEEVELFTRIQKLKIDIYYDPDITLGHRIHLNKVDKEYILKRWKEEGKATGIILSKASLNSVIKNKTKRLLILYLRDYPNWIFSKATKNINEFYYFAKIERSKEILKNLTK